MSRERWGTFSVVDHKRANPFVVEAFLYDRLVLPYPSLAKERTRWAEKKWAPDRLDDCLKRLGARAYRASWDEDTWLAFREQHDSARSTMGVLQQRKYVEDAEGLTRTALVHQVEAEAAARGERPPWVVAAYPSAKLFQKDYPGATEKERTRNIALVLAHRFLVPRAAPKDEMKLLKDVIDFSSSAELSENRTKFYEWQEKVVEKDNLSIEEAIAEMDKLLKKHDALVKKEWKKVYLKFGFTVLGIGLGLAAAAPVGLLAGAGALVSVAQFAMFDRKAVVSAAETGGAVMFYDARKRFGIR